MNVQWHDRVTSLFADHYILYLYDQNNLIELLVQYPNVLLFIHLFSDTVLHSVHYFKQEQITGTKNTYIMGEEVHEQEEFLNLHVYKKAK